MTNWPQTTSKFPAKKKCTSCGSPPYPKGVAIYKIQEAWWCSNEKCPKPPLEEKPEYTTPAITSNSVPKEKIAYHDHAWEIALTKATKIYPPQIKEFEGIKVDKTLTSRMILAQVFYKALMRVDY